MEYICPGYRTNTTSLKTMTDFDFDQILYIDMCISNIMVSLRFETIPVRCWTKQIEKKLFYWCFPSSSRINFWLRKYMKGSTKQISCHISCPWNQVLLKNYKIFELPLWLRRLWPCIWLLRLQQWRSCKSCFILPRILWGYLFVIPITQKTSIHQSSQIVMTDKRWSFVQCV